MKIVAVVSGGMDSVTLLHYFARVYRSSVLVVSFDYGQRHLRELRAAKEQADRLALEHRIIPLPVGQLLPGSSITDNDVETPHGHYSAESMRKTVVPGRNAMMLSVAWAVAAANGAVAVATAVHAGDHYIYPDCRPKFVAALGEALHLGTLGHTRAELHLETPFMHFTKAQILYLGYALGVDYAATWTCYEGGALACGQCGACQERLAAFAEIGRRDPLEYVRRELIE